MTTKITSNKQYNKLLKVRGGKRRKSQIGNFKTNIPFVSDVSPEIENKILQELEEEVNYNNKEQRRIEDKYNSERNPSFRLTGEYLLRNSIKNELEKWKVCKDLKISIGVLTSHLCDLNKWENFPIRFIPISKKRGFIQVATKDYYNYSIWRKKTSRTISSKIKTYQNTVDFVETNEKAQLNKKIERMKTKKKLIIKN